MATRQCASHAPGGGDQRGRIVSQGLLIAQPARRLPLGEDVSQVAEMDDPGDAVSQDEMPVKEGIHTRSRASCAACFSTCC